MEAGRRKKIKLGGVELEKLMGEGRRPRLSAQGWVGEEPTWFVEIPPRGVGEARPVELFGVTVYRGREGELITDEKGRLLANQVIALTEQEWSQVSDEIKKWEQERGVKNRLEKAKAGEWK